MNNLTKYLFVFLSAFGVTYVLTPLLRMVALSAGMVDLPGKGRIHEKAIARSGGIGVFFGVHIGCAAVFLLPWSAFDSTLTPVWWFGFFVISLVMLLIGIVDDCRGIHPWAKLCGQVLVAVLAFCSGMQVGNVLGFHLPLPLDLLATVLWFLAIINAFNLIDGMDGLATGLASLAAMGIGGALLFRHLPGDALVLVAVVGACLAFLRYNFHPASVFLGDAGSMFLGFTLAAVSLSTSSKDAAVASIGVPILAMGVPVLDAGLAIWRRSVRSLLSHSQRRSVETAGLFQRDMDHLHHRLMKTGISQTRAALWLYLGGLTLVAVGLLSIAFESQRTGIFLIAFVLAVHVIVRHLASVELLDSGRAILMGLRRPRGRALATLVYVVFDVVVLAMAACVIVVASHPEADGPTLYQLCFESLPMWVGIPFIVSFMGRTYSRIWSMACVTDYMILASLLFGSIVMTAGALAFSEALPIHALLLQAMTFSAITIPALVSVRSLSHFVRDALSRAHSSPFQGHVESGGRIIVCGATRRFLLFLHELRLQHVRGHEKRIIVGLLDEDRELHGRFVHGYRVRGGLDTLAELIELLEVDELALTADFDSEDLERILSVAASHGIRVTEPKTTLNVLHDSPD